MPKIKVKGQTVQTGEHPQTNGRTQTHTHGRYQTYYLPCYAVDNNLCTFLERLDALLSDIQQCEINKGTRSTISSQQELLTGIIGF